MRVHAWYRTLTSTVRVRASALVALEATHGTTTRVSPSNVAIDSAPSVKGVDGGYSGDPSATSFASMMTRVAMNEGVLGRSDMT